MADIFNLNSVKYMYITKKFSTVQRELGNLFFTIIITKYHSINKFIIRKA